MLTEDQLEIINKYISLARTEDRVAAFICAGVAIDPNTNINPVARNMMVRGVAVNGRLNELWFQISKSIPVSQRQDYPGFVLDGSRSESIDIDFEEIPQPKTPMQVFAKEEEENAIMCEDPTPLEEIDYHLNTEKPAVSEMQTHDNECADKEPCVCPELAGVETIKTNMCQWCRGDASKCQCPEIVIVNKDVTRDDFEQALRSINTNHNDLDKQDFRDAVMIVNSWHPKTNPIDGLIENMFKKQCSDPSIDEVRNMAKERAVTIIYTNYRCETTIHHVLPLEYGFGVNEFHKDKDGKPEPQWFMKAIDLERNVERDFAIKDIKAWYK